MNPCQKYQPTFVVLSTGVGYNEVINLPQHQHTHILSYEEFLASPETTIKKIDGCLNIPLDNIKPVKFNNRKAIELKIKKDIKKKEV